MGEKPERRGKGKPHGGEGKRKRGKREGKERGEAGDQSAGVPSSGWVYQRE